MTLKLPLQKLTCCVLIIPVIISLTQAQAPSYTGKFTPVLHDNINGFYEYLPRNYAADIDTKYPLIVFFHAAGEVGAVPDSATLAKINMWGTPKLISNGAFPDSFNMGGQWHKFIVIAPQIKSGVWTLPADTTEAETVDAVVEYAKAAYRVDLTRVYVCGMSMGGGATWEYAGSSAAAANKLAAIVVACGAGDLTTEDADIIAASNLPVLATHNKGDTVVSYTRTEANAYRINSYTPAINPTPKIVEWEGGDHNVWSRTYEDINPGITTEGYTGNLRDTLGINVYEWMLQFTRSDLALPVKWQSFTVKEINGAAVLRWTVEQQVNTISYTVEKSSDGVSWASVVTMPAQNSGGDTKEYQYTDIAMFLPAFFYRIRQTDADGTYGFSAVQKFVSTTKKPVVKIFPNPFQEQVVINYAGPRQKNITVKLVDAVGHVFVKRQYPVNNNDVITIANVKHLASGVYYAVVINMV